MSRVARYLLVGALSFPAVASAQTVTVGPDLSAPTTLRNLGDDNSIHVQSLTTPVDAFRLLTFSFYWTGTSINESRYYAFVGISRDPYDDISFDHTLNNSHEGWYTINYNMDVASSEQLYFFIMTNGVTDGDQVVADFPHIKVTTTDTYTGGAFLDYQDDPPPGPDMLFQARFATGYVTPEPATIVMLTTGLAGLAGSMRRRRGQSKGLRQHRRPQ